MLDKLSDSQLVTTFRVSKDEEQKKILLILYDRYKHLILKICYGYLKDYDLASDIFHDIFIKIIENINNLTNGAVFKSWAMVIAKNLCVDYLRKTSIVKEEEVRTGAIGVSYGSHTEDRYIAEIDRKTVLGYLQTCLRQLADVDLNILKLRWRGFQADEITKVLKIEKGSVRRSYDRIKYNLETCMQKKGFTTSINEIIRLGQFNEHES